MKSPKQDPYKIEWDSFWKNPDITDLERIIYRMEFETVLEGYISGQKEALKKFFHSKSQFFPNITNDLDILIESDYFTSSFQVERFINKFRISLFFHSSFFKQLTIIPLTIFLFFIFDILIGFKIFCGFLTEPYSRILLLLITYIMGITFQHFLYFSISTDFKDKKYLKIQNFMKIFQFIITIIYLISILLFFVFNATKNLSEPDFVLQLFQFLCITFIYFFIFLGITNMQIYLIDKNKFFLYYMIRLIHSMKFPYEINRSRLPFYLYQFLDHLDEKINKSIILKIDNIEDIEGTFYKSLFTDELERLDQIGASLEKFIIKNNKLKNYKNLDFFTVKSIVNLLNSFFENASLPILAFKRYRISDFIIDKSKTIISILVGISSLISAIFVFF